MRVHERNTQRHKDRHKDRHTYSWAINASAGTTFEEKWKEPVRREEAPPKRTEAVRDSKWFRSSRLSLASAVASDGAPPIIALDETWGLYVCVCVCVCV